MPNALSYTLILDVDARDSTLALALSPDGRLLATTGNDQKLRVRDAGTLAELKALQVGKRPKALCFSPDSQVVVAGATSLTAWSTSSWKRLAAFKGHRREVMRATFSPDGRRLWGGGHSDVSPFDNSVRCWEFATESEQWQYTPHGSVCALAVSPDGATIAVATTAGVMMLLDAATGAPRWPDLGEARANGLVFTPSGRLLGTHGFAPLFEHDLTTGARRALLPAGGAGLALALDGAGDVVFIASAHKEPEDNQIQAIDLVSGETLWRAALGRSVPTGLAVSADGRRVYVSQIFRDRLLVFERS